MSVEETIKKYDEMKNNVEPMPIQGFRKNDKGKIIANSIQNIELILEHDPLLAHKIAFNEFTYEIELLEDIPELMLEKGTIDDDYPPAILGYIEKKYHVLFKDNLLRGALTNVARRNVFNPVLDYFEECEKNWDETIRSASLLPDFLGVEASPVTTLQTQIFFVGAVAKAYHPEMKFDYVLDLVGGQGAGKTTFLKKMANGWYTDQFTDFENKDNYSNMLRALIVNDDEMTATNHSSFEVLKKFISSEQLEYRKPYGHMAVRRYKSFVMARTTNELTYLKDKTGDRRFMPNLVSKERQKKSPLTDLTPELVAQLWGEFTAIYRDGFSFLLSDDEESMLEEHRKDFMYIDAEEEAIDDVLQKWNGDFITSADIALQLGEDNLVKNRQLAKKIKYVMDNHYGWTADHQKVGKSVKRGYRR
ncbi:prophage Lp3 protein 8, helicase [Lactobacillus selangorensis]|uniref:Prophage Lp3 protein 8, helicase n=1 Tax=Lactobacillus selangorensis TaxID=81857 RepID=A0A0R2FZK5_9LACO|nr:VapE domain-containing protein [Lactobacillus selangorensis]KRN27734.1 prophage Lp3 protein 8, helicase [Lactobacillus selangorensis]KRN30301.1 prophage Lp3 protein 8, helicase [Lactobacillus selangorensis]